MIKKLLLSSLATTAIFGSALAADLPARAPPVYIPPPPVMTWAGFYVGVNGGGIWTRSRDFVTTGINLGATGFAPSWSVAAAAAATNVITTDNRAQFLVGGTWGYNWQFGAFVLGTESDFQGVFGCRSDNGSFGLFGSNNNNTCGGIAVGSIAVGPPVPAGFSILNQQTIHRSLDWLNTSRVRAGFLVTPTFLIYGTGGFALGRVRVSSSIISSSTPFGPGGPALITTPGISTFDDSRLRAGFVGGGGLEWMFLPNWSLKAEALYYDLGRSTLNQLVQQNRLGTLNTNVATQTTWRNNGVIARAGINYHIHWFDAAPIAPVVARY
jgi:outer membrane immunogenic protein